MAGRANFWKSVKQTLVASSTIKIEFVACYEAFIHGIWLQNFITRPCILEGIKRPLKLYCDNKLAVLYSNNNKSSSKLKYIDIKFLVMKERVQSNQISTVHIGTNSMIVYLLTKGFLPMVFNKYIAHMGVVMLHYNGSVYFVFNARLLIRSKVI